MALTTAQRTTVRNAFVTLATSQGGFTSGGVVLPSQWADENMARLDAMRDGTVPRSYYTMRVQPFINGRLSLTTTIKTAITNHVNGS
jgi:hypothetical protein